MNRIYCFLLISLLTGLNTLPLAAQTELNKVAIGKWRDHQNYSFTKHVVDAGDKVFVATDVSLFSYDKTDGSIERYSKVDGLCEMAINTIAYNKNLKALLIAYVSSNIDILVDGRVYNISGLKNKMLQGDKTIYNITFNGNYAYLSCGFGILVVDMKRKEIKDTYIIGDNGNTLKINNLVINDTSIFAATEKGIMYAKKDHPFLAFYGNWKSLERLPTPSTGYYKDIFLWNNSLVISEELTPDASNKEKPYYRFYYYDPEVGEWKTFIDDVRYTTAKVCNGDLVINCDYVVYFCYPDFGTRHFVIEDMVNGVKNLYFFNDAVVDSKNKLWIASLYDGLIECIDYTRDNQFKLHCPSGPVRPTVSKVRNFDNNIYVAPGGRDQQYANLYTPANIFILENNKYWSQLDPNQKNNDSNIRKITDVLDVSIDNRNPSKIFAATWSAGLLEIEGDKIVNIYNETNSPLEKNYVDHSTIRIAGSAFDSEGNLWIANSLVPYGLCVRRANGNWERFRTDDFMGLGVDIHNIVIDPFYEYKWIIMRDQVNKIYIFDNKGSGRYINPNNGSKRESSFVNDIAFDWDGIVWIGTNKGVKVIYSIDDIFTTSTGLESMSECHNITYSEGDQTQYLLEFENISSITVDGANRKWIGTLGGGVFLVSADGTEQLIHFSAENSPLPSNSVVSIDINKQTGEVFFGTDKGIASFKSDATGFGEKNENVYVYPNPVRSGYTGPIAIKGLVRDAIVKITDVSGNLVCNLKALGGQAIWDGKNMSGKRVPSGIYLAFIADSENTEKAVTKILFLK